MSLNVVLNFFATRSASVLKMSHIKTIHVPHLGGIEAGYQMPQAYDASKPTVVMVNSFMTTSDLYKVEFENADLVEVANLIAIEPLGHGQTRTKSINFTYWDTAMMNLQVLAALGINGNIFVVGTSQGGWVTVRMALLAPEKVSKLLLSSLLSVCLQAPIVALPDYPRR